MKCNIFEGYFVNLWSLLPVFVSAFVMVIANKNNAKVHSVSKVNRFILQVFHTLVMTFLDDVAKKCLIENNFNFVEENCRDLDIELIYCPKATIICS